MLVGFVVSVQCKMRMKDEKMIHILIYMKQRASYQHTCDSQSD